MILTMLGEANWFIKVFATLFVWALDSVAYLLVSISYNIFTAVSQLNIFSNDAGAEIYTTIVDRFYMILSIVMIFVFAYFLIMMIINPEGDKVKASTTLVKETIISFIAIALLPTIYNYMSLFQDHVIHENTIGTIILGGNGLGGNNAGKNISMIVFTSFYHPVGTTYSTFIGNDGEMVKKEDALKKCTTKATSEVCETYYTSLEEWLQDANNESLYSITGKKALRNMIGETDGMEYLWIISTACAVIVAYFFFSYAIDLGTRAVKLGFLQIISPVPIILRIFPQTKKTFDTWFDEMKKTYLEVFLRVAVIFFIVLLCQNVPIFISAIFGADDNVAGGLITKSIATVALILGLLKFAKDAPALFKTLFSTGGGLFAGLDLKPGVKRRINENEYAMKGLSTAVGGIGGMVGTAGMRFYKSFSENVSKDNDTKQNMRAFGKSVRDGLLSMPRGLVTGGKKGFQSTPTDVKDIMNSASAGMSAGQASLNKAMNTQEKVKDGFSNFFGDPKGFVKSAASNYAADVGESIRENALKVAGVTAAGSAALETVNKSTDTIKKYMDLASKAVEPYEKAFEDLNKKLIKGESIEYNGKTYTVGGDAANNVGDLKELKGIFDNLKNEKIAETIDKNFKAGGATYMATLRDQMSKELGNLGAQTISEINSKVKANVAGINDFNDLLTQMSDKTQKVTVEQITALNEIKSILNNQSKNIVIQNQQKNDAKSDKGGK